MRLGIKRLLFGFPRASEGCASDAIQRELPFETAMGGVRTLVGV